MSDHEDWIYDEEEKMRFGYKRVAMNPRSSFTDDGRVGATDNMNVPLNTYPGWADKDYQHPQTVFGWQKNAEGYDYDDRLRQFDCAKSDDAWERTKQSEFTPKSANWYQHYLRQYFNDPGLKLAHLMVGINHSNGYPYIIFGYTRGGK